MRFAQLHEKMRENGGDAGTMKMNLGKNVRNTPARMIRAGQDEDTTHLTSLQRYTHWEGQEPVDHGIDARGCQTFHT